MKINKLAIPLLLNSVSSTIISMCDQAMIGRTSLEGFASVSIISSNIYSLTGLLGLISVSFNIVGSRSMGRKDYEDINNSFALSIFICIVIGLFSILFCNIFSKNILKHIFNIRSNILVESSYYFKIYSMTIGLNMVLFILSAYFKIINKTKYILYSNLIACISNTLLNYILIFGKFGFLRLGISGAAIGTVLSLILGLSFYIIIIIKHKLLKKTKINIFKNISTIFKISTPIILQEFVEGSLYIFVINYILSKVGILSISAYNIVFLIINITLMPMYAYSQASLSIISEEVGANNINNICTTIKICIKRAMIFYLITGGIILLFRNSIPGLITNDYNLIFYSSKYLIISLCINIFHIPCTILKSSMQALGKEKDVFIFSSITSIGSLILIYLLVNLFDMKLLGIYLGLLTNYIILLILLLLNFNNEKNKLNISI